jgi:hypothetical protein
LEHIVGVNIIDTNNDTIIAIDNVIENSLKNLPTIPSIKMSGINTAIKDILIDITVNTTSFAPINEA